MFESAHGILVWPYCHATVLGVLEYLSRRDGSAPLSRRMDMIGRKPY